MSSTPPPPHTPPPLHYPGDGRRVGHRLRPGIVAAIITVVILIAAAVTAAIVLTGKTSPPASPPILPRGHAAAAGRVESDGPLAPKQLSHISTTVRGMAIMLTAADPIDIAQGISITPAPGWSVAERGPNWVTLSDANEGAKMRVTVKPAGGTDVAAALLADVNNELARTVLTNVRLLGGPATRTLDSPKFESAASVNYTADHTVMVATTHLLGVFMELLNTSNQLSAFIDYRESRDAPSHVADAGQLMIDSML